MIVYAVMKHEMWAEGGSELDSIWMKEDDAIEREKEIDFSEGYCGSIVEMNVK